MPDARAIKAGEAFLELTVRDKNFAPGLQASLAKLRREGLSLSLIGAGISAAGAGLVAPFIKSIKTFSDVGDELNKMSARTGESVEKLSELGYAADQSGTSLEILEKALQFSSRFLVEVGLKAEGAQKIFQQLGLSFSDLIRKSPGDTLEAILIALGKIPNPTIRSGLAMQIFDRQVRTALLPMIGEIAKLKEEFKHFNLEISTETAVRGEKLRDAFTLLSKVINVLEVAIGDTFAEPLTKAIRAMAEVGANAIEWVKANHRLVASVAAVGAAIFAVGAAITAFGLSLTVASIAMSAIIGLVGTLLSPFVAIPIAIATAGAAFVGFANLGARATGFLADNFSDLAEIAGETFSAIGDALMGGDIVAAANVLWAGLNLVWVKGIAGLRQSWIILKDAMLSTGLDMVFGIEKMWVDLVARLETLWQKYIDSTRSYYMAFVALLSIPQQTHEENVNMLQGMRGEFAAGQKDHQKRLDEIESERKSQQDAIKANAATADDTRKQQFEKNLDDFRKAQVEAQKGFNAAKMDAKFAGARGFGRDFAPNFQSATGDAGALAAQIGSRGTFSGKLAPQIFGAGAPDKIPLLQLRELQRIAKSVERQEKLKQKLGLTVGGN